MIARTGGLRVVFDVRALDFWHCHVRALYPCSNGVRRYGKAHATVD
ncbi:hypothetical protein [Streptomyces sp. MN13]